ncbi:MAG TPA: CopD family protein [Methylomirabilota bacterium]|nr:CopD family protein [Methylomirabilota bacterium]
MNELGLVARFVHLAASILTVGSAAFLIIAGHSDRATARRWQAQVQRLMRALVVMALAAGVVALAQQAASLEQRPRAAVEPAALWRVAVETHAGAVWIVRQSLLLLLGGFIFARADVSRRVDWRAARAYGLLLAGAALALLGAAGHAAAVEPGTAAAVAADMFHVLAAGVWAGALPALTLLLASAWSEAGADARPYAVVAARRFSRTAVALMVALAFSGTLVAVSQIGSIPALVGTRYGRLLLLKLALLVPIAGLAALNRRLLPQLSGEAGRVGRPAMRRLGACVAVEAIVAVAILGVVAVMGVTAPARHEQPVWPFTFRLAWESLAYAPESRPFVLVGSQVAVLGVAAAIASRLLRRRARPALLGGGAVLVVAGLAMALPPLATDAYPTTYQRPAVPYQAGSIATGAMTYREHCAACHGAGGAGNGPAAAALSPPPSDLRAHHAALHTAGDLFWWITHGRRQMPAFGERLDVEARWDLVNFIRALAAGDTARELTPLVQPERPLVVAPDFAFAVGPTPPRTLKDYRGRRSVLVVLYTLPASRARLSALAARYDVLVPLGVEIIAVPTDAAPDAIKQLGAEPRVLFPVVTDGAAEIVAAYGLLARAPHAEFLVDRQGYLRAIDTRSRDTDTLVANVEALNRERVVVAPPAEHVH